MKNHGGKFEAGVPRTLFDSRIGSSSMAWFDISKDGRFLIPAAVEESAGAPLTVVVNWQAELKR